MNLELTDEQKALVEASADALSRVETIEEARAALDAGQTRDQWATAVDAGWTGLLVSESYGGAELSIFDGMLVQEQCGHHLVDAGLLGHLPATLLLDLAAQQGDAKAAEILPALAAGDARAAMVHARQPTEPGATWTTEAAEGDVRLIAPPVATVDGAAVSFEGSVGFQPDAGHADYLVAAGQTSSGEIVVGLFEAKGAGVTTEALLRYDGTRALGNVTFSGAKGHLLQLGSKDVDLAWTVAQALLAADALGVSEAALNMAVEYAKERHAFGRPIGSYQAVKGQLVEMLRLMDRTRSLTYYTGYAVDSNPEEFSLAASCARAAGEEASSYNTRTNIAVHGGIGATWEHDAPFFWRRAQLSRVLLGGEKLALQRIAADVLVAAEKHLESAA